MATLKKTKRAFQDCLVQVKSIAECSLPFEHSAILFIFIKLQVVIKTVAFALSIFERRFTQVLP